MANTRGRRQYPDRSGRIRDNVESEIIFVTDDPKDAGYLALTTRMGSETTHQEKFEWDVDDYLSTSTTVSSAVASTTSKQVPVANATIFRENDLYRNARTGEIMKVENPDQASSIVTFTRQFTRSGSDGTAAAAINSGDTLYRLGPALGEDNRRQSYVSTNPTGQYNYCQIFRYDIQLTRRQRKRSFLNNSELPLATKKAVAEARKDINATMLLGERVRKTVNGEDITTTQGIYNVPTTNIYSVGGTLYEYGFDEFLMEQAFLDGSSRKACLASKQFMLALSEMTKDRSTKYQMGKTQLVPGVPLVMQAAMYYSPDGGELMIIEDRTLSEAASGSALILDMDEMSKVVFSNNGIDDDFKIIEDTADKDDFGKVDTIYADCGIKWGAEQHHALITGVTSGASGRAI